MDAYTPMAGWAAAAVALIALLIANRERKEARDEKHLEMRLNSLSEDIARHSGLHSEHFTQGREHAAAVQSLSQWQIDHEARDDERFDRIESMHREIREDIKTLLKR